MHYGRVVASAVVAWLAYLIVNPLMHDVVLADLYAQHAALFRPIDQRDLVIGYAVSALGFLVFAFVFAKGYEGGVGAVEGLRFGVVVGLLLSCLSVTWTYVILPVSGTLAMAWAVGAVFEMGLYGVLVGLVYKPVSPRRWRT